MNHSHSRNVRHHIGRHVSFDLTPKLIASLLPDQRGELAKTGSR